MSKKRQKDRKKKRSGAVIPIHGISVALPWEIALSPQSNEKEIRATAERLMKGVNARQVGQVAQKRPAGGLPEEPWLRAAAGIATNAWKARAKMSCSILMAAPLRNEPMTKPVTPISKTLRRPNISDILPASGTVTVVVSM